MTFEKIVGGRLDLLFVEGMIKEAEKLGSHVYTYAYILTSE